MNTIDKIICVLLFVIGGYSIGITVDSQQDRCMVVFSQNPSQYLKIDIKFSAFHNQQAGQHYRVQLINTQTRNIQDYNVTSGNLRKQIQLTQNIIYKLCIRIITKASRNTQVQQYIQYNCMMNHGGNVYDNNTIKIPQNILKSVDLSNAYRSLIDLKNTHSEVIEQSNQFKQEQNYNFENQQKMIKEIEFISIVECIAILVFGCYQYFRLKNVIENKHRT